VTSRPVQTGWPWAVTGPTGEIGIPFVRSLEGHPEVAEIRGMARSPFDPSERGWTKTHYVQGDVLDPEAVARLVDGADVVVHLAFLIFGDPAQSREIYLTGSRNVFEAAVAAGVQRIVYTSSVAAYGFHEDNELPLTEDAGPRGSEEFYYSAQKAELERTLEEAVAGSSVETYVFRPSIVGGPDSPALVKQVPYVGTPPLVPAPLRTLINMEPGIYNLAAPGEITMTDLARELGWRSVPVLDVAVDLTAALLKRLPGLPPQAAWIQTARVPVVMDTTRAREKLGWEPQHDVVDTLRAMVHGAREAGLVDAAGRPVAG
jgi:UDP-glucose 4-epimerase